MCTKKNSEKKTGSGKKNDTQEEAFNIKLEM